MSLSLLKLDALDFLDLGSLALQRTQVVQLGAADLTTTDHFDVINAGGMQRERTLDAYAIRGAANGERFADGAVATGDDGAFKGLKTLAGTFDDLDLNADGIANVELRDVVAKLLRFDGADDFVHGKYPPFTLDVRARRFCADGGPPYFTV